jgi:hypothetical protein
MFKGSLTSMLPEKYQALGYSLSEDEDILYLWNNCLLVHRYYSHGAQKETVIKDVEDREIMLNFKDYMKHIGHEDTD